MFRNLGEVDQKTILRDLNGWGVFPQTEDGHAAAISLMSGEESAEDLSVEWDASNLAIFCAANEKVWGESPVGITPMRMNFSVYLADDVDSNIYYSAVVDEGELFDVIVSDDGSIIGNIYLQDISDSGTYPAEDDDDKTYSLSIITDDGMIGRSYFGYSPDAPLANKVLPLYTSTLSKIARVLSSQPQFQAAISDFETSQSITKSLEVILVNNKEMNESFDWYNPVQGLSKWKVQLPFTEDGITNALYQHVADIPSTVVNELLYTANGNKLPWFGKSARFLLRPQLEDIRLLSYSHLLTSIEVEASRIEKLMVAEEIDEVETIQVGDLTVTIHTSNEKQPAFYKGEEISIFSFRVIAFQEDLDAMFTFDFIGLNETDVYKKDIRVIIKNLIESLQGVSV